MSCTREMREREAAAAKTEAQKAATGNARRREVVIYLLRGHEKDECTPGSSTSKSVTKFNDGKELKEAELINKYYDKLKKVLEDKGFKVKTGKQDDFLKDNKFTLDGQVVIVILAHFDKRNEEDYGTHIYITNNGIEDMAIEILNKLRESGFDMLDSGVSGEKQRLGLMPNSRFGDPGGKKNEALGKILKILKKSNEEIEAYNKKTEESNKKIEDPKKKKGKKKKRKMYGMLIEAGNIESPVDVRFFYKDLWYKNDPGAFISGFLDYSNKDDGSEKKGTKEVLDKWVGAIGDAIYGHVSRDAGKDKDKEIKPIEIPEKKKEEWIPVREKKLSDCFERGGSNLIIHKCQVEVVDEEGNRVPSVSAYNVTENKRKQYRVVKTPKSKESETLDLGFCGKDEEIEAHKPRLDVGFICVYRGGYWFMQIKKTYMGKNDNNDCPRIFGSCKLFEIDIKTGKLTGKRDSMGGKRIISGTAEAYGFIFYNNKHPAANEGWKHGQVYKKVKEGSYIVTWYIFDPVIVTDFKIKSFISE
ncbi:MAG: hypothetical protein GY754_15260 [bacterium]|nr:hypothetical protein [bacterium]